MSFVEFLVTAEAVATGTPEYTKAIDLGDFHPENWVFGLYDKTAGASSAASIKVQYSPDKTNWVTGATLVNAQAPGTRYTDLSGLLGCKYMRLELSTATANVTSWDVALCGG